MKDLKKTIRAISRTRLSVLLSPLYGVAERLDSLLLHFSWTLKRMRRPGTKETEFFRQNVTFIFKSFERQRLARRLYENIQLYYPGVRVIIADDSRKPLEIPGAVYESVPAGGNGSLAKPAAGQPLLILHLPFNSGLSFGLNRALERVETPFVIRMDDDELLTPATRFGRHLLFLRRHPEADLVAVMARGPLEADPQKGLQKLFANDMSYAPLPLKIPHLTKLEEQYVVVGKACNIFLARTDPYRAIGYDDRIRMIDHDEFFRRAAGRLVSVQSTDSYVSHYHNLFDRHYEKYRGDTRRDAVYIRQKYSGGIQNGSAGIQDGSGGMQDGPGGVKNSLGGKTADSVDIKELYRAIFPLLRSALWSETFTEEAQEILQPEYPYWHELLKEMSQQTVELLPILQMEDVQMPADIRAEWEKSRHHCLSQFVAMQYVQKETCELLEEAGVPNVVMKGFAAAACYPHPELRRMGDVDLLVLPEDYMRAHSLMEDDGFVTEGGTGGNSHIALRKEGIEFELHRRPPGTDVLPGGEEALNVLQDGLRNRETITVCEVDLPVMPWQANGIELIWHVREHLYNGLGLRQIIDWMMFADRYLDDAAYPSYEPVLEKCGVKNLALAVTRMCQIYLGLDEKNITWCSEIDEKLCGQLMDFIIEQGNFGMKKMRGEKADEDKTAKVFSRYRSPVRFLVQMQRKGEYQWKALQRHPWLRPFAWLYTAGNGVRMLADPVRRKNVLEEMEAARDRRDMLRKLE